MLRTVHVSMHPHVPYLVDDAEYAELEAQGLLIPGLGDVALPAGPAPRTVPSTPDPRKEAADGDGEETRGQVAEADG